MKHLHLIVNPAAGTMQAKKLLAEIVATLTRADYLCTVYMTGKRGDAAAFSARYGGKTDLIVACGGDGTFNETVSGLLSAGHTTPIGYIPCGSTNDFANGLGIPLNLMDACETIIHGQPRTLDVGRFGESRYFCYTASFGLFTQVSWATSQNAKNMLGHTAYILEGIRSLTDVKPVHMKVTAGEQTWEDDYLFGAVCNSTSLGGGVLKLEDSQVHMNDGLFEAMLIPFPGDWLALNRVLTALRTYRYDDPTLCFRRAPAFLFEGDPTLRWTLDGEPADPLASISVQNLHSAIQLVC